MTTQLIETHDGGIATRTMNRPESRNAMSGEMLDAMHRAMPRLAADPSVRLVVLTGAGGAFCAGGDVKGFAAGAKGGGEFNMEQRVHGLRTGMELSRWLHEMPKPTLAVIPGPAAGAGLSLALACDLRIAVDTAKSRRRSRRSASITTYRTCKPSSAPQKRANCISPRRVRSRRSRSA
jgi:2-(1,2-epoxy-1,2-dihydrophenyl)acetyl-CoA isomerase